MSKYGSSGVFARHLHDPPGIPWGSETAWGTANLSLQHLCDRHQAPLVTARRTALRLKNHLESLVPLLENLCRLTCATCQAPCCHIATVWFDYKDLVFMHLCEQPLAVGQLTRGHDGVCSCCGPSGCRLPRLSRPWTCSWYLCPTQKNILAAMPGEALATFEKTVAAIKQLRLQLETEFIRITS
jgi:hypothetical protein